MKLKIITHEKIVFDGEVDELGVNTTSGTIGVLKDHIPITTSLKIGVTKAKCGDDFKNFATMGGVFQFKDNNAVILTDVCEEGCDIDVTRAKSAKERAEALKKYYIDNGLSEEVIEIIPFNALTLNTKDENPISNEAATSRNALISLERDVAMINKDMEVNIPDVGADTGDD